MTETEKELGVAVADIGAGTIDLTLFADGSPFHTAVLPVGGNNVTNDVAIGVKTTLQVAEELKVRHGTCDLRDLEDEEISVSVLGEEAGRTVSREELCQIIESPDARDVRAAPRRDGAQRPRHAARGDHPHRRRVAARPGTAELGRDVLQMPVRVTGPSGISGLIDTIQRPVVRDGGRPAPLGRDPDRDGRPARTTSRRPGSGGLGRIRSAIRSIFP